MAEKIENAGEPITIKKYANRRLYNTAKSTYVTLDHLAQMVRDGQDFVVTDAKTGEDITRGVLAQIIFEEEAKGQTMMPSSFLRQLIRLYGDSLQGIIGSYLERSIQVFSDQQQQLRGTLGNLVVQTPWSLLNQLADKNMEIWKGVQQGIKSGLAAAEKPDESPPPPPAAATRARRRNVRR